MGRDEGSHAGPVAAAADKRRTLLEVSEGFQGMAGEWLLPIQAVLGLPHIGPMLKTAEDIAFVNKGLSESSESGVYEVMEEEESEDLIRRGHFISSAFMIWQGKGEKRKGRFSGEFSHQSNVCENGFVNMKPLKEFAAELHQRENLM